jgi:large subunit ribosomal protein L25
MKIEINATTRGLQGTGASRRLRRAGKVPGIVYGGGKNATPIELDHNELFHKLKMEAFHASVLNMKLDGGEQQVLLRDVQMHPFRSIVGHVDFQRVEADQKIHMKVPLHFINAEIAPGVKLAGGLASHVMNEIDIVCLPANLPEYIEVDLANLAAGHSIHVKELNLPTGVEVTSRLRLENPVVATIVIPKAVTAEEEAATAAAVPAAADVPAVAQPPKEKVEEKAADKGKDKEKKK